MHKIATLDEDIVKKIVKRRRENPSSPLDMVVGVPGVRVEDRPWMVQNYKTIVDYWRSVLERDGVLSVDMSM